jgi:histidinol-phosphate/aromatic aminotransferase/cobyric acid decarboxylase-like protein
LRDSAGISPDFAARRREHTSPVEVPPAGPHGGDVVGLARALGVAPSDVLDLSASLNPVAAPVTPLLARHLDAARHYPDAGGATAALASVLGVERERVLLTNGGAEAIALLAGEWPEGWVDDPDFSLYRRHLAAVVPGAPRWRSNPHNPSGALAAPEERAEVWDESFFGLATGRWTRGDKGAVVVGSLTKVLACPGLRVGYVLAEPALIRRLAARQPRWAVNGLACAALPELLDGVDLPAWASRVAALRDDLAALLSARGWLVRARDAPWVLVDGAGDLRATLARSAVLVRDCTSFGMPGTVRVAVPDGRGLERLGAALPDGGGQGTVGGEAAGS